VIKIDKKGAVFRAFDATGELATIRDRRLDKEAAGRWEVSWRSGRIDWHNTYREARANVLKGSKA